MNCIVKLSSAAALAACCTSAVLAAPPVDLGGAPEIVPHRINSRPLGGAPTAGSAGVISPAITWHGGTVLGTPNVYVIWYGNWNKSSGSDTAAGQAIVTDFLQSLGGSPYFNINQTYSIGSVTISGAVSFDPSHNQTFDSYSQGSRLRDSSVQKIVNLALSNGSLPTDYNALYFVLTSSDVAETSGFCTQYCGWHTHATLQATDIKYSFVGNAARCLSACAAQTVGPNGNAGVDGMVSVIAHELEETTSDPDLNAWKDSGGAENADKCAWTFGTTYPTSNGAWVNMQLTVPSTGVTRDYLIQRNLYHNGLNGGDYCEASANGSDPAAGQTWPTPLP